ncbi:hypothetical protein V5E97_19985 [Singulisphaera sp. Ch08]|uniref:YHS domain-containing protein n=1 Tax=Singulisphaera sp. Ch08 TaxID=3120278 RepID=A0AAU7CT26_9BACT
MQKVRCLHLTTFAASFGLALGLIGLASAHDGHKHGAPLHGGKVAMTKEYHFEVVFAKDGLKVYPRSHEDQPVDASRLTGTATFYHPSSPKPWFERKLAPTAASPGRAPSSIGTAIDFGKVPTTGVKVEFKVEGLPEAAETTANFTTPLALAPSNEFIVTKATQADARAVAALKICPVSKEDLDSMGGPLKVTRDGKSTFICCKGCLKGLRANPDKFFGAQASASAAKDEHDHDHKQ